MNQEQIEKSQALIGELYDLLHRITKARFTKEQALFLLKAAKLFYEQTEKMVMK